MNMESNWSSPSNSSLHPNLYLCTDSRVSISLLVFGIVRTAIMLPFSIMVLYQGHRQWKQQPSFKTTSHSDFITYHFASMQLFGVPGIIMYACGFYVPHLFLAGTCILALTSIGELLFHVLTCVERYLAVVHPIIYLELKNPKGAKIRHLYVGTVWLFSFGWIVVIVFYAPEFPVVPFFCLITLCYTIVSFCSLSVLCALIRPGPGETAGKQGHTDQSKQKAFHTIMVITAALCLLFTTYVVCSAVDISELLSNIEKCWMMVSASWFSLPSSLVVPLLFLHRAGKLRSCCAGAEKE